MYVNDNTDNIHNKLAHVYCLLHPSVVSYIILSFMKKIPIHTVNQNFHMFTCNTCIMIRVI